MYNNKKKIAIIVMLVAIVVMAVGYAAFSTSLNIGGTANIDSSWKVYFSYIQTKTVVGKATNNTGSPMVSELTATMNVDLKEPGDSIEYEITITNGGDYDALINAINTNETGSTAIIHSISGIEKDETIAKGTTKTFTVKIEYDKTVTVQPTVLSKTLTLSVNCIQAIGGGSSGESGGSTTTTPVFNKETPTDLTFTSQEDISTFKEVRVDNVVVDSSNYTVTSGSTIVTLNKEYLNTLSSGTHTMDIVSTSNTVSTSFEVSATQSNTSLVEAILSNNEVYADNVPSKYVTGAQGIDFSQINSDTNGKGLYYTSTNTENNGTTYYFRGAVDNNYVKFGQRKVVTEAACLFNGNELKLYMQTDKEVTEEICNSESYCIVNNGNVSNNYYLASCDYFEPGITFVDGERTYVNGGEYTYDIIWRIVRINEDRSIRIVTQNNVGTSLFNTNNDDNAYVGYMYGTIGATGNDAYKLTHTNTTDSTIKDYLDDWYNSNLSSYSSYLADAGFCNDRSVAPSAGIWFSDDTALGYGTNRTHYGAYNRLYNEKQPQFACPNASRDLFTTSTSSKGNKALTNPIGLLTADEVWYAGATNASNQTYYLYTGSYDWTMSPDYFYGGNADVWGVSLLGDLGYSSVGSNVYDGGGVRPVVNLQSTVELSSELSTGCTKQDGTASCPYIIKTN